MENIRNFCIISHIDHGKSTLADRFLEMTNTVPKTKMREQFLDAMDLERGRGITIKMHPVRMNYNLGPGSYLLNLIDTPGHVDFSYEVSRSLAAVEGAVLLVDATKGIQAQTIYNLELAKKQNLVIIPAVNKIDLPQAKIEESRAAIANLLNVSPSEVFLISAKEGKNVKEVLEAVIKKIPPPGGNPKKPFRALIFDSKYDPYKGIIAFLRVVDGQITNGEKIYLIKSKSQGEVKELGYFKPELKAGTELKCGEVGYLATGIKEPGKIRIGDTISLKNSMVEALPGYREPQPMVFLSVHPASSDDFVPLKEALERLKLNDAALTFKPEMKEGLGRGFQCGFLGLLHTEIVTERLKREFNLDLILSSPSVIFKIINQQNKETFVYTPADWPEPEKIKEAQELWAKLEVLTPKNYLGQVLELLESIESRHLKTDYFEPERVELSYEVPLREIINKNFYDKLKSATQGFASMNYEIMDWRAGSFVKLDILILGKKEEVLSKIVPEKEVQKEGKKTVEKLKEILPSQLFSLPLQAAVGGKIIARETIKAKRRDVIAPLYGGDYTRKRKLLERQKKGKKDLKEKGRIKIPPAVFLEMFKG
jgi:GTP-binding protein LepA